MNTTFEKLSSNKVRVGFEIESDRFEEALQATYRKNVSRINVQGFRRGKAPRKVIEMIYGEGVFYEDAIDSLFPAAYDSAIKEYGFEPVDRPEFKLEEAGKGKELKFTIDVFVKPDVELGQYKGLAADKAPVDVTEDDVNAQIERDRERVSRYIDVEDRPAKLDDQVNIDYEGTKDGVPFEGGAAAGHALVLGSGAFIPGFEDGVVGMSIGEERDIDATFPEDYHVKELSGQEVIFHVKVNSIQEKDVPALDDEFAKDVSECETFEAYKAQTREKLVKAATERAETAYENQLVEAAVANAKMDIPEAMIEERIDQMMQEMSMRMRYQGLDLESYYKYTGETEESLRAGMRERAESDVKTRLTLEAIMKAENVEADDVDVDAEIASYCERNNSDLAKLKEGLTDEDRKYFERSAQMKKTLDIIKDSAVPEVAEAAEAGDKE